MSDEKKLMFKAFDENFQCRGFQYEVGKTYTHDGPVKLCGGGFHACSDPWDVLNYYPVTSRFASVEVSGTVVSHGDKSSAEVISILEEYSLDQYIKHCQQAITPDGQDIGDGSQLVASGDESKLAASGGLSQLAASGGLSQLAASGYRSQLAASGDGSKLAASGCWSKLAASGCWSKLVASGGLSNLAASGDGSQLVASGDESKLATSGGLSQLAASGNWSKLVASGDESQLAASGEHSVCVSSGIGSKAKTGDNGSIVLTYWCDVSERYRHVVGYAGEDGIKPHTWYEVVDGKLTETTGD